ncbi:MAG: hypothetical protein E6094_06760 [Clostridium perfringens]|nr:hypothetical protein [Clostridium perfringens]
MVEKLKINDLEVNRVDERKQELKNIKEADIKENNKKFFDSIAAFSGYGLRDEKEYEVASKILNELVGIKVSRATSILNLCNKAIQESFISFQENTQN